MQYLAQWRMQAAARLLLETHATVAAIALDVGYDSEAAFARAFKRLVGKPPAAWRRERQAMVSDSPRAAAQSERAPTTTAASNSARAGRDSGST